MFKHWRKNEVDGIIFLLIIGGLVGVSIWRKKVKKAAQDKLFAEQWDFLRSLEEKIDSLIEKADEVEESTTLSIRLQTDTLENLKTLNQGLI